MQFQLQENFSTIEKQILSLSNQTDIFKNEEENNEDNKKNGMMKQFKMLLKIDQYSANKLIAPRARNYMIDWDNLPIQDHNDTLIQWMSMWKTNKTLEELIMEEEKWYKTDMKYLRQQLYFTKQNLKDKFGMYLVSIE